MVQRMQEKVIQDVPGLDFAIGTHSYNKIPDVIAAVLRGDGPVLECSEEDDREATLDEHIDGSISAFVNILFGCDRHCAYCIVPEVRGKEWSRNGVSICNEVSKLAESGVKEVTLLGQSVMSYGRKDAVWAKDFVSTMGFQEPLPRLLEAVSSIEGIKRVRFTSGHPSGCSLELARAMGELPEVCGHLHLPVQSGADRILKMMGRGYDRAGYIEAVGRIREKVPDLAITTDVIVGFPSETEDEFEATRSLMEEISFDNAFIFKYSPRPDTRALKWEDDVSDEEKLRRNKVLLDDQDKRGTLINEGLIGKTVEVMAEGPSKRNTDRWAGRSSANKIVIFEHASGVEVGDLVDVLIERAMPQTLYGKIEN
ncbi:hypothetical protein BVX94_01055 [bacterium B17]|nr:hypothetical protein BVX94_01055 [bacterium B17]